MKDIPTAPPLPDAPPDRDFSKLGFVYITVLGLADQVVPHTGSWRPLATALNYLVRIAPIVYMAFQARPASPVGVQPDSSMSRDTAQGIKPNPAKIKAITSMPPPTNVGQVWTFLGMVAYILKFIPIAGN
ncbi:Sodium channel protein type 4 subunit alpha [Entomophthora muscae]|uniref:Sodium channel protein type 4 subunit alpha n=1 Tax=Entomophthora muscae TaxID=34485 RepID=A0ACC2UPC5_9FUNG|nr:Sodium channel protein type 4 subunit alpha [Entomophthora muscae]